MDARTNIDAMPAAERDWALFLDIDGTLLDIAPTPDTVTVPSDLPAILEAASRQLGGALAVVSGRPLAAIDSLFSHLALPCAAEHGAVLRFAGGSLVHPGRACRVPAEWRQRLEEAAENWRGVIVDPKAYSIAMHYRLAPERQSDVCALLQSVAAEDADYEVIPARMAYELRHRGLHKGAAVRHFMEAPPFAGRIPVFVGDDVTDEDGFEACRALGGLGLHVEQSFGADPAHVRAWLRDFTNATA